MAVTLDGTKWNTNIFTLAEETKRGPRVEGVPEHGRGGKQKGRRRRSKIKRKAWIDIQHSS